MQLPGPVAGQPEQSGKQPGQPTPVGQPAQPGQAAPVGQPAQPAPVGQPAQPGQAAPVGQPAQPVPVGAIAPQPYAIPAPAAGLSYGGTRPSPGPIQRPSGDGTGNFRIACRYSHMNYDDSIIAPNQPGRSHLHVYFGNTESNAMSTAASLLSSGNSTCDGGISNRSSYWLPAVVDGGSNAVVPQGMSVYYKSGYQGIEPQEITSTFPNGLKIIAGNSRATTVAENSHALWECRSTGEVSASIPACGEGSYLQARVEFPQCWDGVNLDSPDHKSHMAYGRDGGCPASHPVAIPDITFNVDYIVGSGGTNGWRLSSDMAAPGGVSLHADIITAWDPAISSQWLNNCTRQNADCHVGQINDRESLVF